MTKQAGFTVIEIVVVAVLISFLSGMILYNSPRFNMSAKMNSAARQLSFAFRDAEARSTAVRQHDGSFPKNYGVRVESVTGKNTYLILFVDTDNDQLLNDITCASGNECVKVVQFEGGIHISKIVDPNTSFTIPDLTALFYRPYPSIYVFSGAGPTCIGGQDSTAFGGCESALGPFEITLSAPDGSGIKDKTIKLWTTGQISIN